MNSEPELAVLVENNFRQQCSELARYLELPLIELSALQDVNIPFHYVLSYSVEGLVLQQLGAKAPGPVYVDFTSSGAQYRRLKGGGELIVKAIGGSKQQRPTVIDATAGLGRDSFVLASWGYPVIALERSKIVASLLADGVSRARLSGDLDVQDIMARLQFVHTDAIAYLQGLSAEAAPDVVYIDPMFPQNNKTALVKKHMRAFHQVVAADGDSEALLDAALQVARYRVVVKRPKKAEFIANRKPAYSLDGKAIRFDIYSLKSYKK